MILMLLFRKSFNVMKYIRKTKNTKRLLTSIDFYIKYIRLIFLKNSFKNKRLIVEINNAK